MEISKSKRNSGYTVRINHKDLVSCGLSCSSPRQSLVPDEEGQRTHCPSRGPVNPQSSEQERLYEPHSIEDVHPMTIHDATEHHM